MECAFRSGVLHVEDVPLTAVAAMVGTPVLVVSAAALGAAAPRPVPRVQHVLSVRSIASAAVLRRHAAEGCGADVTSGPEMHRALTTEIAPAEIGFSGIAKNGAALAAALAAGIGRFTLELEEEAALLSALALARGTRARALLRVASLAPNPPAFPAAYERLSRLAGLDLCGLAISAAAAVEPAAIGTLIGQLRAQGHRVERVDLTGVPGGMDDDALRRCASAWAVVLGIPVAGVPPGAAMLLTRVLRVKRTPAGPCIFVDAGRAVFRGFHAAQPRSPHMLARVPGARSPHADPGATLDWVERGDLVVVRPDRNPVSQLVVVDGSRCEMEADRVLAATLAGHGARGYGHATYALPGIPRLET
ncbi:hypothetical protein VPH46_09970 [Sphingomonas sp. MJ1 (PH-R8)]|uniref:hypothetical protein n=1 Tax=Sphingomonas sp. MJ1 (PH-R8) TaxID=3112950 RepID=UPI003A890B02